MKTEYHNGLENIILEISLNKKVLKTLDFFLLFDGDGPPELESRSGEGLEIKIPLDNSSCNF